jgi:hypothetical protein
MKEILVEDRSKYKMADIKENGVKKSFLKGAEQRCISIFIS